MPFCAVEAEPAMRNVGQASSKNENQDRRKQVGQTGCGEGEVDQKKRCVGNDTHQQIAPGPCDPGGRVCRFENPHSAQVSERPLDIRMEFGPPFGVPDSK